MSMRRILRRRPSYDLQAYTRAVKRTGGANLIDHWPFDDTSGVLARSGVETLGSELVTNGTMEADANWSNWNTPTTNEQSNTQVHIGTYSRKFTVDATSEGIVSDTFTTATGTLYKITAWVYPDDATIISIGARNGADAAFIVDELKGGLIQDAWNEIVHYYTETAGGAGAYFVLNSHAASAGSWYIDDVSVRAVLTGEPLTITGATLGQAGPPQLGRSLSFDGNNDVVTAPKKDDETGATWGAANHGLSLVDGTAFLRVQGVDLSGFAGVEGSSTGYYVALHDSAGKTAWGYVGAADAAQALGTAKGLTGITKANPGVVTFNAGHGYSNGMLIKFSGLTEMTELNGKYCTLAGNVGDTFTIVNTSAYGAAETTGGNCAQQVTHVGTDGIHIVSARNGATRNWAGIEASFNYNDAAGYTFEIYSSRYQITGALTVGAWVKTTDGAGEICTKATNASLGPRQWRLAAGWTNQIAWIYGTNFILSTTTCIDGKWHFIVATGDGTTISLFIDGILQGTAAQVGVTDQYSPLQFGFAANGGYLQANLAHPVICNRALSATEIRELYTIGRRAHSG
uniref:Putative tail protein n=2 Tax=viral metagenome TaxID=1070528 RepID=A0A6M3KE19_9ZZZZ